MTAADIVAYASAELDAIMKISSSPTVDNKAAALKALLIAELPTLAPSIIERRLVGDRRKPHAESDDPTLGDRRVQRRVP